MWILEDSIVGWQKSLETPFDIPDYKHNNVLRATLNGTNGDLISSDYHIPAGAQFNNKYSFQLPLNHNWNLNNIHIIAFVYDEQSGTIKQVASSSQILVLD